MDNPTFVTLYDLWVAGKRCEVVDKLVLMSRSDCAEFAKHITSDLSYHQGSSLVDLLRQAERTQELGIAFSIVRLTKDKQSIFYRAAVRGEKIEGRCPLAPQVGDFKAPTEEDSRALREGIVSRIREKTRGKIWAQLR